MRKQLRRIFKWNFYNFKVLVHILEENSEDEQEFLGACFPCESLGFMAHMGRRWRGREIIEKMKRLFR